MRNLFEIFVKLEERVYDGERGYIYYILTIEYTGLYWSVLTNSKILILTLHLKSNLKLFPGKRRLI